MAKIVLDTNVIVSGTLVPHGNPAYILRSWRGGRFLLVISQALLEEIAGKLNAPRLRKKYGPTRGVTQRVVAIMRKHARLVPGRLDLKVIAEDSDDDQVIIAAVEGSVDYIVSGDSPLRDLGEYQGIKILSPAEFARLLEAEPQS